MKTVFPPDDIAKWCATIYGPGKQLYITDYAFETSFGVIAANDSKTNQIQIQSNADFVLTSLSFSIRDGNGGLDSLQITDSATGEQFFNQLTRLFNVAGSADSSFQLTNLHYPRWIGGNSSLTVTAKMGGATPTTYLDVTLRGFLVRQLA